MYRGVDARADPVGGAAPGSHGGHDMALDAVVSRSFVVIRADQTAAEARSGMDVASAEWVIVERPLDDGTAWYLFPIGEAIARLDRAPGASIVDALDLHEWSRSSVASADADPASVSGGDVVLRDGRPIGLIDPRGPTATTAAEPVGAEPPPAAEPEDHGTTRGWHPEDSATPAPPRARRGGQRAKPPGPAEPAEDKRSVEATFPGSVKADAIEWLTVEIANQAATAAGLALGSEVKAGNSLDILIQPRRGFQVVGDSHGSLEVPASGESPELLFKLKAVDVGKGEIRVVVSRTQKPG